MAATPFVTVDAWFNCAVAIDNTFAVGAAISSFVPTRGIAVKNYEHPLHRNGRMIS